MALWFETSLKYEKTQENGSEKSVCEKFLVDALSLTDAEASVIEHVCKRISGEYSAVAAKRTKISEVFFDESDYADKWWIVKINFLTVDDSGREKKSPQLMLVQASDFNNAYQTFLDRMKGTMADFEIASISETAYMDVFPYDYSKEE
ncbi:MAG: DUF4494 domain-containing protein [Muribaculaceae bacterium]|nr:DUF4494 domain-containing protein [Muribaculaceae bacterium]